MGQAASSAGQEPPPVFCQLPLTTARVRKPGLAAALLDVHPPPTPQRSVGQREGLLGSPRSRDALLGPLRDPRPPEVAPAPLTSLGDERWLTAWGQRAGHPLPPC